MRVCQCRKQRRLRLAVPASKPAAALRGVFRGGKVTEQNAMKSTMAKTARLLVEELEPRILYSADAAVLLHPAVVAGSAEVR